MFRQGAFQESTPKEAYFVKCDGETTTQSDMNGGMLNVVMGFAPLKPAKFVVITLHQIAGETEARAMNRCEEQGVGRGEVARANGRPVTRATSRSRSSEW